MAGVERINETGATRQLCPSPVPKSEGPGAPDGGGGKDHRDRGHPPWDLGHRPMCVPPRSPKARDRGHPMVGMERIIGTGAPDSGGGKDHRDRGHLVLGLMVCNAGKG